MSPEYVRPYVKAQKNDDLDAEAIAEAGMRPTMRFVEVKSQAQSDIQALHRARERLVSERTALINHLRALLLERGIVAPQGRRKLEEELSVFADEDGIEALSPRIRLLIEDLRAEWRALDERIAAFDGEFVRMARDDEAVRRLRTKNSWDRDDQRDRAGGVARIDAAPDDDRRKAAPAGHQQAWQSLSSQELDPWRTSRAALPRRAKRRLLAGGHAGSWPGRTRTLPLLRWPTSLRASLGRSWRMAAPMTPDAKRRQHRGDCPSGVHRAGSLKSAWGERKMA